MWKFRLELKRGSHFTRKAIHEGGGEAQRAVGGPFYGTRIEGPRTRESNQTSVTTIKSYTIIHSTCDICQFKNRVSWWWSFNKLEVNRGRSVTFRYSSSSMYSLPASLIFEGGTQHFTCRKLAYGYTVCSRNLNLMGLLQTCFVHTECFQYRADHVVFSLWYTSVRSLRPAVRPPTNVLRVRGMNNSKRRVHWGVVHYAEWGL